MPRFGLGHPGAHLPRFRRKILSALIVSLIEYEYPTNGAIDMLTGSY